MISLILATKGHKKKEIIRFLNSVKHSKKSKFEIIIVCQDEKGYLDKTIKNFDINIQLFYTSPGLSRARNIGIKNSNGNILGFPDDDCVYTNNMIENIETFFKKNTEIDIVSFNVFGCQIHIDYHL